MNLVKSQTVVVLFAASFCALAPMGCDRRDTALGGASTAPAPDNSGRNAADRTRDAKTPMDQGQSSSDVKISAEIRKQILQTPDLSVNAQNCKVITLNGAVTLRGPVASSTEKATIVSLARRVSGVTSVEDQLEVK